MSSRRFTIQRLLAIACMIAFAGVAQAGTTGKIAGIVSDGNSGLPLPNANVTIVGTTVGGASTEDGEYSILNVPAGTYNVQASVIGYTPMIMNNVLVSPDFTTTVDFGLTPTVALTVETIEATAERPLIQRDATSSVRIMDAKEYENLPTRGYQDAVSLQSGVVGSQGSTAADLQGNEANNNPTLFIRGGRANEVAYFVDGFSQQDPLTGYTTTAINSNSVEQVVVHTGGFNAEYGRIMSGAVNVVTKDGGGEFFGSVDLLTDNLGGDWIGTNKYDRNVYDISVGGPLLADKVTFFVSGERRWYGDRSPRNFETDLAPDDAPKELRDGFQPNNTLSGQTWQGNVSWRVTPSSTLKFGANGSNDDWREYYHEYAFNIAHAPRYEDKNQGYNATWTQNLDKDTFFDVKVNYFATERKRGDGIAFDDLDAYAPLAYFPSNDSLRVIANPNFDSTTLFFASGDDSTSGHVWDDYLERKSAYWGLYGNVTRQLDDHNQLKGGFDFQIHTLRRYQHLFPATIFRMDGDEIVRDVNTGYDDVVNYGYDKFGSETDSGSITEDNGDTWEDGPKNPKNFSFYLQDKFEYNDFVLNAGIRYDYLDPSTPALVDPVDPYLGGTTLDPDRTLTTSKSQNKVSPRLGFGFPISETTQFRASYGKFFQQPNLEDLYTSYRYMDLKIRKAGYYYAFGNPNLEPGETTAYEVGLKKVVGPQVVMDVTAYYKDITNLVQVQNVPASPASFASYANLDFGTVKGIDFGLAMRETNGVSASVNYSLSFAKGTGSATQTQRDIAWTGEETPKQTAPLAFDKRHGLTLNLDLRGGREAGPKVGNFYPFEFGGLNLLYRASSGFPYTPIKPANEITLASISTEPAGPLNSVYGPWTMGLDLKASRGIPVGGRFNVELYVVAQNILNNKNQIFAYGSSGSGDTTNWLSTEEGRVWAEQNGPEAVQRYLFAQERPDNFDIPRIVSFGLKFRF